MIGDLVSSSDEMSMSTKKKPKTDAKRPKIPREPRKKALKRHLRENNDHIDEDYQPNRTIVRTKYKRSYDFAWLEDSIKYGIFMD